MSTRLTMYEKPACSTCRTVMMRLKEAGIDFDDINYIIEPIGREKIAELVRKIGEGPRSIVRTREPEYAALGLDDPSVTDDRILDALAAHPQLLQRPILEYGERAALVRPPEKIDEVINEWSLGKTAP